MKLPNPETLENLELVAHEVRRKILELSSSSDGPNHLGGSLSIVEILTVLYGVILKYDCSQPEWAHRDRFILSKGHAVLALYVILNRFGLISDELLATYKQDESELISHPIRNTRIGVESSNGSLGHGLSIGVGLSLAARLQKSSFGVYVLIGDGECDEGSIWEAAMFAAHYKLHNLTVIVDNNGFQSDGSVDQTLDLGDLGEKWRSFGWRTSEVNGHSMSDLVDEMRTFVPDGRPHCIVARTVKGMGVPFMENNNEWHHNRLTPSSLSQALSELR